MEKTLKEENTSDVLLSIQPPKRRRMLRRLFVSVFLSAGILIGLINLAQVSPFAIVQTLRRVSWQALLVGFLLHLTAYFLRSLRFRILIQSKKVPLHALFDIVAVHNLLNHVLPMRAGELSYIYLARYRQDVPLGEGLGTLTVARTMDLMAFTLFYPLAILFLYFQGFKFPPVVWKMLWCATPLFLVLAGFLCLLFFKGRAMMRPVQSLVRKTGFHDSHWIGRILNLMDRTVLSFEQMKSTRVWIIGFLLSLVILAAVYLVASVLLAGMGYPMTIPLVIFCSTLAYLGSLLPLYSFAGFGTLEAGWVVGCLAAGFSKQMGLTSGFSFHIIVLVYVTLIGLYGLVRTGTPRRARNAVEERLHTEKE